MKNNLLIACTMFLLPVSVQAQEGFGSKGGADATDHSAVVAHIGLNFLDHASLKYVGGDKFSGSNVGFTIGAYMPVFSIPCLGHKVLIGPDLSVASVGGNLKFPGQTVKFNTTYINITALAIVPCHRFAFGIGPNVGIGIGGKYKGSNFSDKAFTTDAGIWQLKRACLNLCAMGAVHINNHLVAGINLNQGITNLAKDNDVKIHHTEVSVFVGYKIDVFKQDKPKATTPKNEDNNVSDEKEELKPCSCLKISFVMNKPKTQIDAKVRGKVEEGTGADVGTSHYKVSFDANATIECTKGDGNCAGAIYMTVQIGAVAASRKFPLDAACGTSKTVPVSWSSVSPSAKPAELAKKEYTVTYTIEVLCGGAMQRIVYTADLNSLGLTKSKWGKWEDVPKEESKQIQEDFEKKSK